MTIISPIREDVLKGILNHAKNRIEEGIKKEAEKIVAKVIMDTLNNLSVTVHKSPENYSTNVNFIFTIKEGGNDEVSGC